MKKLLSILFVSALLVVNFTGCGRTLNTDTDSDSDTVKTETAEETATPKTLEVSASETVVALQFKDIDALAGMIHPEKGVRFSPYGYIDTENNLTFDRETLISAFRDNNILTWGGYDGTGLPINLTFSEYIDEFVYDINFNSIGEIAFNEIIGTGNSLININEVYPDAEFVEYHFAGTEENFNMDWKSLRLVFEKLNGAYYLVGIIHDEWTI